MITGREPKLSSSMSQKNGFWRLSPRRLATILNVISPEAASLPAVEAAMHSDDFFVRYNAAVLLAKRGDRDARLVMESVLENGNIPSRASAARHLYGFSWYSVEPLFRKALADEESRVREGAVFALCQMKTYEAYQLLLEALAAENYSEVLDAPAWMLRDCHDPMAVKVLEIAMKADDPDVRSHVLEVLASTEMQEAIPVVRHALFHDNDPDVIYNAALSYVELAEERSFADFAELLASAEEVRLQFALRGFFHATNYLHLDIAHHPAADALIDVFERAVMSENIGVRKQAIWPLAWTRHERIPEIVFRAYENERNVEVKAYFLRVVVSLMMPGCDELLGDALASSEPVLREMAEQIVEERQQMPQAA